MYVQFEIVSIKVKPESIFMLHDLQGPPTLETTVYYIYEGEILESLKEFCEQLNSMWHFSGLHHIEKGRWQRSMNIRIP
jgi:hypothetical protein